MNEPQRKVRIRPIKRSEPDLRRLARALIELATTQNEKKRSSERNPNAPIAISTSAKIRSRGARRMRVSAPPSANRATGSAAALGQVGHGLAALRAVEVRRVRGRKVLRQADRQNVPDLAIAQLAGVQFGAKDRRECVGPEVSRIRDRIVEEADIVLR